MGGSYSKQTVIKDIVSNITLSVLVTNTSSGESSIVQTNDLLITGSKNFIMNIEQENAAKVNLSVASRMVMDGTIQAQIMNSIVDKLMTEQNVIGIGISETDVRTIVNNNVNATINVSNLTLLSSTIEQKNKLTYVADETVMIAINQRNKSDAILNLVSTMATNIAQQITSSVDAKTDASVKQSNPISEFLSSNLFMIIILVVIGLAIAAGGWYYINNFDESWSFPSFV